MSELTKKALAASAAEILKKKSLDKITIKEIIKPTTGIKLPNINCKTVCLFNFKELQTTNASGININKNQ